MKGPRSDKQGRAAQDSISLEERELGHPPWCEDTKCIRVNSCLLHVESIGSYLPRITIGKKGLSPVLVCSSRAVRRERALYVRKEEHSGEE